MAREKTERALGFLRRESWAGRLVDAIEKSGGIQSAPAGLLFELRFAYEARRACPDSAFQYEFNAGVGDSTVDFFLAHDIRWLIELVSLDESRTITSMRRSSRTRTASGIVTEATFLSSEAADEHQTLFAELIRVGEKIEEKVWDKAGSRPRKFPTPGVGWAHMLVVNMRGFLGTGDPDGADCHELIFGSNAVRPEHRSDNAKLVTGLFDPRNTRPGAIALQRAIDVIAFVVERDDKNDDDEIRRTMFLLGNPRTNGRELARVFPLSLPEDERDPLYRSEDDS